MKLLVQKNLNFYFQKIPKKNFLKSINNSFEQKTEKCPKKLKTHFKILENKTLKSENIPQKVI